MGVSMTVKTALSLIALLALAACSAQSQDAPALPAITMGNGVDNRIEIAGVSREDTGVTIKMSRDGASERSAFRMNATRVTLPSVTTAQPGWVVLHPVKAGVPDGDIVAGYARVEAGRTAPVVIETTYRADAGDSFLVMLHKDANDDGVFDFVFREDGVNVEDIAVFEGNVMVSHILTLPE